MGRGALCLTVPRLIHYNLTNREDSIKKYRELSKKSLKSRAPGLQDFLVEGVPDEDREALGGHPIPPRVPLADARFSYIDDKPDFETMGGVVSMSFPASSHFETVVDFEGASSVLQSALTIVQ
ncbi:uncharacterized protein A4U43_C05F10770 [Asparagus officinalis]|uniref:Uncharacterized protein n=1 Tax=Asparagus officinalis TaxID=4686 RepID=A0A5P1EQS7_ASPOF|nr:uncharacterized protein A4U43_C05F10770 [Asparagus officinalis]